MITNYSSIIAVAVGILLNKEKQILLCQRPADKSYGLQWEFPGGKVEGDESAPEALRRELKEELTIEPLKESLFHTETTTYSDGRTYRVDYFIIEKWHGTIHNQEFADMAWVHPDEFDKYMILAGNVEVCRLLIEQWKNRK